MYLTTEGVRCNLGGRRRVPLKTWTRYFIAWDGGWSLMTWCSRKQNAMEAIRADSLCSVAGSGERPCAQAAGGSAHGSRSLCSV